MSLTYGFCLGDEGAQYNSQQFSSAFQSAFGDGVCPYGGMFDVTATDSMNISLATGFALVGGRWVKSDEVTALSIQPSDNNFDRYDAVVLQADMTTKTVETKVIMGKAEAFPKKYIPKRDNTIYEIVLCYITVRMGVSQIFAADIEDTRENVELCGIITQLSDIAESVLYVYEFLTSGIDEAVDELRGYADSIIQKGDDTVSAIEDAMQKAAISKPIGELETLRTQPEPHNEWLLCNGEPVPVEYPLLSTMLGGFLPTIKQNDERFSSWIYAGNPMETI